ncbi:hypothetical protein Acr_00g0051990 [Actinidia rufa]|uniref:Uncharacterized protein n=1 Tax=Actinidia rufa TaxID=165716 RepID=A0A7J0DKY6_9ERIC|nr:hypothetical protein Acr_00g0051990 [Actinidia rufa]
MSNPPTNHHPAKNNPPTNHHPSAMNNPPTNHHSAKNKPPTKTHHPTSHAPMRPSSKRPRAQRAHAPLVRTPTHSLLRPYIQTQVLYAVVFSLKAFQVKTVKQLPEYHACTEDGSESLASTHELAESVDADQQDKLLPSPRY